MTEARTGKKLVGVRSAVISIKNRASGAPLVICLSWRPLAIENERIFGKCARLHGHSFKIEVSVVGPVEQETGWFVDYAVLADAWAPLQAVLDHNYLNEVPGLENPTSENIARWIWNELKPTVPQLSQVIVRETCTSGCIYRGQVR